MTTTRLEVTGMTCNHCVSAVEKALRDTEGVSSARVDLKAGSAEVEHAETVAPERLTAAVEEEGYKARVA